MVAHVYHHPIHQVHRRRRQLLGLDVVLCTFRAITKEEEEVEPIITVQGFPRRLLLLLQQQLLPGLPQEEVQYR